jgi:superfamily II DNA helicase RecQ
MDMPFAFFVVPITSTTEAAEELNRFLRQHRALSVERRWVEEGTSSFWSFCVDYIDTAGVTTNQIPHPGGRPPGAKPKIDYRETLSPEDFAIYARLRDLRKEISAVDAIPLYTIFTNDQLAQMVLKRMTSKAALESIAGIGSGRVEKYGERMLGVLTTAWQKNHETDRATV